MCVCVSRLSRDAAAQGEALSAAIASAVNAEAVVGAYGETQASDDVFVARVYEHQTPSSEHCAPLEGMRELGSCVEVSVHVRAYDEAHAATLADALQRNSLQVAEALSPLRLGLRSATAWHADTAAAVGSAAVSAKLRLAAPSGRNGVLAALGPAEEAGLAAAVARSLNLLSAPTVDRWETFLQTTLLLTSSVEGVLDTRALRLGSTDLQTAFVSTLNALPGPHHTVSERDVFALALSISRLDARCSAQPEGVKCAIAELRVFASDKFEAGITKLSLDGLGDIFDSALAARLAAVGLSYTAKVDSMTIVSLPGATPTQPSEIKLWGAEDLPGCDLTAEWRRGDKAGDYDCVDVNLLIVAPSEQLAAQRAASLRSGVSDLACQSGDLPHSRAWGCAAVQLHHLTDLALEMVLLNQPAVTIKALEELDDSGSNGLPMAIIVGVCAGAGALLLAGLAVKLFFRHQRKRGFQWVAMDNAMAGGAALDAVGNGGASLEMQQRGGAAAGEEGKSPDSTSAWVEEVEDV